ncbi:MAG: maleylacetoacetate isomerase [Myxococcaceae bacterium]
MKLYSYWRSSCSWRVRIALAFKGLPFDYAPVNLLKGEQSAEQYLQINPWGSVPVLEDNTFRLSQSPAILEYLEEAHPTPPLLPKDLYLRARARELSQLIISGIQPYQNLAVLKHVKHELHGDDKAWAQKWLRKGMHAVELLLRKSHGTFSVGDQVTIADLCLIPQLYGVRRFGVDEHEFPTALKVERACEVLEPFKNAHPDLQPDAQPA